MADGEEAEIERPEEARGGERVGKEAAKGARDGERRLGRPARRRTVEMRKNARLCMACKVHVLREYEHGR